MPTTRETVLNHPDVPGRVRLLLRALYVANERLLAPMLEMLDDTMLPAYIADVDRIWSVMSRMSSEHDQAERLVEAVEGLQFHSVEFLRRQARFLQTRRYEATSATAVYEEVYQSAETMQAYLDGLLLTYVAWPNHYRLLQFYEHHYLNDGPWGTCVEIGPGHGWLALRQLEASPGNTLLGFDISPHSVAYSRRLLQAAGVASVRYQINEHDALKGLPAADSPVDRVVLAEVLEHVEDPAMLLQHCISAAHDGTRFFISTVVNIEAIDHLYLYRTIDEVRAQLKAAGLLISDELIMPLVFADHTNECYEVAFVAHPGALPPL